LEKRFANNIHDALKIDDAYLTLSQCSEIEKQDIEMKINEQLTAK